MAEILRTSVSKPSAEFLSSLESGMATDLTIFAGKDKVPVRAHKVILITGSPVLKKMLVPDDVVNQPTKTLWDSWRLKVMEGLVLYQGKRTDLNAIDIPELNKEELILFLKYLHTGEKPTKIESALPLLNASEIYGVPVLASHCAMLLKSTMLDQSVLQFYEQATFYKNMTLEKSTLGHICKNARKIVELDAFLEISIETLQILLASDSFAVLDELQLFEAVLRWAYAEIWRQKVIVSSQYLRSVLEKVIHLIRFPQMTPADFSMKVATAQVLTPEETAAVLIYLNTPRSQRSSIRPGIFNPTPRQYFKPSDQSRTHKLIFSSRKFPDSKLTFTENKTSTLSFQVNSLVWIRTMTYSFTFLATGSTTFGLFGANDTFKIKLEDADGNLLAKKTVYLAFLPVSQDVLIRFDTDFRINKDTIYVLRVRLNCGWANNKKYTFLENMMSPENGMTKNVLFKFGPDSNPFYDRLEIGFVTD